MNLKVFKILSAVCVLGAANYLKAEDGNEPASVWLNNKLGKGNYVPAPWTPVNTNGNEVGIWGRKVILSGSALPEQIVNQGKDMLVSPVNLKVDFGNKKLVELYPVKLKENFNKPDIASYSGAAETDGIKVKINTELEFDGFMKIKLDISASQKVKRLVLDIPFRPDVIGPYYQSPFKGYAPMLLMDTWGKISEKRKFRFYNYFALAGKKHSFWWFSECPEGWRLQKKSRALEVIPSEDDFLFRVNLVDAYAPVKLGNNRKIEFGFQVGPARPALKDWRKYTAIWWEAEPARTRQVKSEGLEPLVCLWPFSVKGTSYGNKHSKAYNRAGRKAFNVPVPEDPEGFNEWLKETKAAGGLVCPYINTDNFELLWGPGSNPEIRKEWSGSPVPEKIPELTTNGFHPHYGHRVCYWSDSWQDYYVYTLTKLMEKYKFAGYYCDNTDSKACTNPAHPDSHKPYIDDDGKSWSRRPMFKAREFYKRIYKAIKKVNPEAIFFVNGGWPPYSFFEFAVTPEYLNRLAGDEQKWPEFVSPEDMQGCIFRGHQLGTQKLGYPAYSGKNISEAAGRAYLATMIMGDTSSSFEVMINGKAIHDFNTLKGKFKIWEAEWIPYWENGQIVSCDSKDLYLTVYKKTDEVLIFISNPKDKWQADAKISFTPEKVFPITGKLTAYDAESGTKVDLDHKMVLNTNCFSFKISVNAQDFRAIIIKNNK